ncbi:MarR family transcriptional regulator [Acuticoccus sp. MNP-M23]|uniref:MarR family winged helix-turn-helix transcriptional regulator n=1 Tax=Acuticoccus sp. MNP-M23 TaxID=3072793 RepID=UPI002814F20D|nr:MarR family transcriptional regulator [Acuticoccus sp. MNP-M23]WMS40935.1 MarR family transcriptional regulator [Acuticoccus sp. MNP-M23]
MFFLKELPTRAMMERYSARFPAMNVDAVDDALTMMRRASLLVRRLEAYFAQHGLSQLRFLVLIVVDREPDRDDLTIGEVIDRLDVAKPVMSRTLQAMAEAGLITVNPHGTDKRAKTIALTNTGKQTLDRVLPGYFQEIDQFMTNQEPPC